MIGDPSQYQNQPQQPIQQPPQQPVQHTSPQYNPQPTYSPPNQSPNMTAPDRSNIADKVEQILILFYFFIAAVLLGRFVLSLFGANRSNVFVDFIYNVTRPFMVPFIGIFGAQPAVANFRLEFEALIGIIVYALIFFGVSRLVKIIFK